MKEMGEWRSGRPKGTKGSPSGALALVKNAAGTKILRRPQAWKNQVPAFFKTRRREGFVPWGLGMEKSQMICGEGGGFFGGCRPGRIR